MLFNGRLGREAGLRWDSILQAVEKLVGSSGRVFSLDVIQPNLLSKIRSQSLHL